MGLFNFFKKKNQESCGPCPYLCGGGVTSWFCDHTPPADQRIKLIQSHVIKFCKANFKRCLQYRKKI
jgi:hypothetical protein